MSNIVTIIDPEGHNLLLNLDNLDYVEIDGVVGLRLHFLNGDSKLLDYGRRTDTHRRRDAVMEIIQVNGMRDAPQHFHHYGES